MTTPTLYQAAQDVQQAMFLCTDEDGVIDIDKINAIQCTFHEKAVATVAVDKTIAHQLTALRSVVAEYEARIKRLDDSRARLRTNLMGAMRSTGFHSIKSDDGILSATLYPGRDESVEIEDGATFPPSLCNDPKPPGPSKTKIKAAILAGEAVAGARIVRHDRLTIK
jgi:hypothetical protein